MKQNEYREMRDREQRCVCKQCGHKLELRLITYNRYGGQGIELYCPQCQRIDYGIEPEIYHLAKKFLDSTQFNYFLDMVEDERSYQLNIAKIVEILAWAFRDIGLLEKNGISVKARNLKLHD